MRQNASQSGTETAHANDTSNNFQPSAKNLKDSGDKAAESESKPRAILLSGFMRSGSSFVGEVFNVHPQVFYMFEPLHPFYNTARVQNQSKMEFLSILEKKMIEPKQGCKKETNKRRIEHLENHLRCNFTDVIGTEHGYKYYKEEANWGTNDEFDHRGNFIFRYKSHRLCKPPFCANDFSLDGEEKLCRYHCRPVDAQLARETCRASIPVAKVIRLCDLELLESILEHVDLKVIMLVRDPRSILASRAAIMTDERYQAKRNMAAQDLKQLLDNLENVVCSKTTANVEALKRLPWLRARTKVLRYEDMSLATNATTAKLLHFAGLDQTNEVAEWLGDIYNDQMEENVGQKEEDLGPIAKSLLHPGRFATFGRNSSLIPFKWMKTLNITTIAKIQSLCGDYMEHFSYAKVDQLPANHFDVIQPVKNTDYLNFL